MKQFVWVATISVLSTVLASGSAQAITFTESNDVGELLNTAGVIPQGTLPLESISGFLSSDADLFQIFLTGGQTFSATTLNLDTLIEIPIDNTLDAPTELLEDPQLFLFDSFGRGIYANDDNSFSSQATLPSASFSPIESGIYYLAISGFGYDPVSADGKIFPDFLTGVAFEPTGVGGGSPLSGFEGTSTTSGSYTIALTGVEAGVERVPEPTSVLSMLALGAGVVVSQLKNKKNTTE
ncbi:MAG: pre-peptidase C-terminal domain-containing protein [Symplocastrum torsivum CPER-KK1]|jgi:hypothetical protein|uniref:Pre-peptidase C-terminal domain-containing protein n=1 Tax=Symplocastrum torsivum CPER-KK1 TaxID=450513 RepID=A0A951UAW5_9CYAN|nr:pre-peptidase C-terminal domain-containing protein [Symplocastrum torsivum CPER-KK1]